MRLGLERRPPMHRPAGLLARAGAALVFYVAAACGASHIADAAPKAQPDAATTALLAEVRHTFRLNGKPIPPEIFRDFGDGDLADSGDIWVTVNVASAIGSNLYYDDITEGGGWVVQRHAARKGEDAQETAYKYVGAADNGLLVAVATYNGGGSGYFTSLHILDLAAQRAYDIDGKVYWQINLTLIRTVPLGDRWDGEISIAKNAIRVVTTRSGPADDSGERRTTTYEAKRP